jgi:hypothetical protein
MKLRACFIHVHRTPVEHCSIYRRNSRLRFRRVRHLHEGHAAGLPSIPVLDEGYGFNISMGCKKFSQLLLCRGDVEIPDKNVCHECILFLIFYEMSRSGTKRSVKGDLSQVAFSKAHQSGCTFSACNPLGPFVTSNCTV